MNIVVRTQHCPHVTKRIIDTLLFRRVVEDTSGQFVWDTAASGTGPANSDMDAYVYMCPDCIEVRSTSFSFTAAADAERDFDKRTSEAAEILEPKLVAYLDCRSDHRRAVLRSAANRGFTILKLNGPKLHVIESTSLYHSLAFDSQVELPKD